MNRQLLIETDGATIKVSTCQLSLLELKTVFDVLLELLQRGEFPLPSGLPALSPGSTSGDVVLKDLSTSIEDMEKL